jgi:hypothetical protein
VRCRDQHVRLGIARLLGKHGPRQQARRNAQIGSREREC